MNEETGPETSDCVSPLNNRVVEKQGSLDRMAAGVAHDFNNLLAAILGNACILLRGMPPEAATRENASQIEACVTDGTTRCI